MGDGTSTSVLTTHQKGVIVRKGENFPKIPGRLLRATPTSINSAIEGINRRIDTESHRFVPNPETLESLENTRVLLEFAKTSSERRG